MRIFGPVTAALLLFAGCAALSPVVSSADPEPVVYRSAAYDFTFRLPQSWRGYSVLFQQWRAEGAVDASDTPNSAAEQGILMLLRHPQWNEGAPRQDIPILVFTRAQWLEHEGEFAIYPGGVEYEIAHNTNYVFAVYSRFAANDSVRGSQEAERIVSDNMEGRGPDLIKK